MNRQQEIEAKGFMVLRFTGEQVRNKLHECSAEIDRVLKNHKGQYKFMLFRIEEIEKKLTKRIATTRYNLEVEKENSFIVNGFATSNPL